MNEKEIKLKVENIYCIECAEKLELEMLKEEYVKSARVNMKKHLFLLRLKRRIDKNKIENDIAKKGYKAKVIDIK